jgi:hypothetical protein
MSGGAHEWSNRTSRILGARRLRDGLPALATGEVKRQAGSKLKIGLNSYSFNRPLTRGKMTLKDVIGYCAAHDPDAGVRGAGSDNITRRK